MNDDAYRATLHPSPSPMSFELMKAEARRRASALGASNASRDANDVSAHDDVARASTPLDVASIPELVRIANDGALGVYEALDANARARVVDAPYATRPRAYVIKRFAKFLRDSACEGEGDDIELARARSFETNGGTTRANAKASATRTREREGTVDDFASARGNDRARPGLGSRVSDDSMDAFTKYRASRAYLARVR